MTEQNDLTTLLGGLLGAQDTAQSTLVYPEQAPSFGELTALAKRQLYAILTEDSISYESNTRLELLLDAVCKDKL